MSGEKVVNTFGWHDQEVVEVPAGSDVGVPLPTCPGCVWRLGGDEGGL